MTNVGPCASTALQQFRDALGPGMPADAVGSNAAPAPSKAAPPKVAYHPNVRCLRGGGGGDPVIVGPMYRAGEGYVCEEEATDEEKAKGPVRFARGTGAAALYSFSTHRNKRPQGAWHKKS